MPIYEYECRECGERTEALQRISDPPLSTCEACGGELKRLLSAPAVQFKGSGWYVTDYADKGKKAKETKESDAGGAGGESAKEAAGESAGETTGEKKSSGATDSSSG